MKTFKILLSIALLHCAINCSPSSHAEDARGQNLNDAGVEALDKGNLSKAEDLFNKALKETESFGPQDKRRATALFNLATVCKRQRKYKKATGLCEQALDIFEKVLGPDDAIVARVLDDLGELQLLQSAPEKAIPLFKRAVSIYEKASKSDPVALARALNNLAETYYELDKFGPAVPLVERSIELKEKTLGHSHKDLAGSLTLLARIYYRQENRKSAALYKRAYAIDESMLGPEDLYNLAGIYYLEHNYDRVKPLIERSLSLLKEILGSDNPKLGGYLVKYAESLRSIDNIKDAEKLEARAKALGYEEN